MLIGLISDTHIPEAASELPPKVYKAFRDVDLILHGGDMHIIDVLDWLEGIAPVLGAKGNGDGGPLRPPFPENDPRVKEELGKAALAEFFEEARDDKTHIMV